MSEKSATTESRKVHATKSKITDALFALLDTEPIERITVAEVCARAQVNRSTFYNHFTDIYDVREQCEQEICAAAEAVLPPVIASIIIGNDKVSAELIETHLGPHFGRLGTLLNGGDPAFLDRIRIIAKGELLNTLHLDAFTEHQEYAFAAVAGMQIGLISHWLQTGCSVTPAELVDYMRKLITQGPRAVLLSPSTQSPEFDRNPLRGS